MREFYRVLKPGCWAILHVPINADKTFENPDVIDPKERERLFGQFDRMSRVRPFAFHRITDEIVQPTGEFAGHGNGLRKRLAGSESFCPIAYPLN